MVVQNGCQKWKERYETNSEVANILRPLSNLVPRVFSAFKTSSRPPAIPAILKAKMALGTRLGEKVPVDDEIPPPRREFSKPAVFFPDVAKQHDHDVFAGAIVPGVLVTARASF